MLAVPVLGSFEARKTFLDICKMLHHCQKGQSLIGEAGPGRTQQRDWDTGVLVPGEPGMAHSDSKRI